VIVIHVSDALGSALVATPRTAPRVAVRLKLRDDATSDAKRPCSVKASLRHARPLGRETPTGGPNGQRCPWPPTGPTGQNPEWRTNSERRVLAGRLISLKISLLSKG
jgi:hypothetical protein